MLMFFVNHGRAALELAGQEADILAHCQPSCAVKRNVYRSEIDGKPVSHGAPKNEESLVEVRDVGCMAWRGVDGRERFSALQLRGGGVVQPGVCSTAASAPPLQKNQAIRLVCLFLVFILISVLPECVWFRSACSSPAVTLNRPRLNQPRCLGFVMTIQTLTLRCCRLPLTSHRSRLFSHFWLPDFCNDFLRLASPAQHLVLGDIRGSGVYGLARRLHRAQAGYRDAVRLLPRPRR